MYIDYPHDLSCLELKEQYLFGESLLVAPVIYEGSSTKKVYFPEGKWLSLFGNEEIEGSQMITWKAPLEEIPVFIRENSVIPLNLAKTYQLSSHVGNRVDQYDQLSFVIYLTNKVNYNFTDDLGNSVQFKAEVQSGVIHAQIITSYDKDITLIFRKAGKVSDALSNGNNFVPVNTIEQLKPNTVCQNGDDLYIQLCGMQNKVTLMQIKTIK
jgi:alpha-D-xyloside xylohydrolase